MRVRHVSCVLREHSTSVFKFCQKIADFLEESGKKYWDNGIHEGVNKRLPQKLLTERC